MNIEGFFYTHTLLLSQVSLRKFSIQKCLLPSQIKLQTASILVWGPFGSPFFSHPNVCLHCQDCTVHSLVNIPREDWVSWTGSDFSEETTWSCMWSSQEHSQQRLGCHFSSASSSITVFPQCLGLSSKGCALWEGTSDEPICTVEHLLASRRADGSPLCSGSFSGCSFERLVVVDLIPEHPLPSFCPLSIVCVE